MRLIITFIIIAEIVALSFALSRVISNRARAQEESRKIKDIIYINTEGDNE